VLLAGRDEAVDGRGPVAARIVAAEQLVSPAQNDPAERAFRDIVIEW
jgi:ribonuclease HII